MADSVLHPRLMQFAETSGLGPSRHFGIRFDENGHFLHEPGNTVVCHLQKGSESEQAVIDLRSRYLAMPEADRLTFTPISSLYMTLFQGIIEYRRALPYWPADIPLDTPIEDMTELFCQRLAHFRAGPDFKVKVAGLRPTGLVMEGVSEADRKALIEWRNRFAALFGYRHPDHDSYVFHITFAYLVRPMSEAALLMWQAMFAEELERFNTRFQAVDLNPPAFCAFTDMKHFEELMVLRVAGVDGRDGVSLSV
ncbi:DUF1868 domain-containing protein [Allorhizobium sp. BGMRC 0089]|uniref:DUF1868 domain-containing protein n=1 Tax=Allorhizobium sonneratiae TaxID=2934936 RepID=UPI0020348243|nr:DUF1868 domain-containing protein [Allorhizobium sonneratiae]MCM2291267.1 DUF1868 domain-containing protein [Allorhizobium sonneratiae]